MIVQVSHVQLLDQTTPGPTILTSFMDEISRFDSRIALLEKELYELRQRRNALRPLCQMPTELIVRIFKYSQLHRDVLNSQLATLYGDEFVEDMYSYGDGGYHPDMEAILEGTYRVNYGEHAAYRVFNKRPGTLGITRSWRNLGSACTRLREICISAPELWTSVQIPGNVQWRQLCLQRANASPLSLKIDCLEFLGIHGRSGRGMSVEEVDKAIEDATSYLQRASAAQIELPPSLPPHLPAHIYAESSRTEDYMNMISKHCCNLKYLSVRFNQKPNPNYGHVHSAASPTLPPGLLGGATSILTTLQLDSTAISAYPDVPNLLHLKLTGCTLEKPDSASGNVLVSWLSGSPRMITLHLGNNIIRPALKAQDHQSLVQMPDLRVLRIHGGWAHVKGLLHPLTLPQPSTVLDIVITPSNVHFGHVDVNDLGTKDELRGAFSCATQFWDAQTSEHKYGNKLSAKVIFNRNMLHPQLIMKSCTHTNDTDPSHPFLRFIAPHTGSSPVLHTISTLHLIGDRLGPTSKDTTDSTNIRLMDLDTVIVQSAVTTTYINQLVKWLTQRKKDDRPIRTLQIRLPFEDKVKEAFRRVIPVLEKKKVVEVIDWIEAQQFGPDDSHSEET